jgi:hypothetical protein
MRPAALILMPFLLVIALQGCAPMDAVVHSKDKGTSIVYPVTRDQAWDIAKAVFRWEGAEAIEEHRNKDYILASRGRHAFHDDAVVCAWVDPVDSEDTMITVATKRNRPLDVATHFTTTTFLWRFAQAVDIIKEGKPLPVEPPE